MRTRDKVKDEVAALATDYMRVLDWLGLEHARASGGETKFLCPWHSERTPSCSIRLGERNTLQVHCYGCGKGGDVFDLVQAVKGVKFGEAIGMVAQLFGRSAPDAQDRARDMIATGAEMVGGATRAIARDRKSVV